MMLEEDKYIDYIDSLESEVIDAWCRGLEELINDKDFYIAEGCSNSDYEELEQAYKEYIN